MSLFEPPFLWWFPRNSLFPFQTKLNPSWPMVLRHNAEVVATILNPDSNVRGAFSDPGISRFSRACSWNPLGLWHFSFSGLGCFLLVLPGRKKAQKSRLQKNGGKSGQPVITELAPAEFRAGTCQLKQRTAPLRSAKGQPCYDFLFAILGRV